MYKMASPGNRKIRSTERKGNIRGHRRRSNRNRPDPSNSDDSSQHKSSQTEKTPVHHVAVQSENHAARDVDITDRRTSDHSVQSAESGSSISDKSSLNVVNNKGPVQLGTGSTVINNPTYYNIHHHHYPSHPNDNYIPWANHSQASMGPGLSHPSLPPPPCHQTSTTVDEAGQREIHHVHHYPNSQYNDQIPTLTFTPIPTPTSTSISVGPSLHHSLKEGFQYALPPSLPNPHNLESSPHTEWRGHSQVHITSADHVPPFQQQAHHPMFRPSTSHVPEEQMARDSTDRREIATLRMGTHKHTHSPCFQPESPVLPSKRLCLPPSHVAHHVTTGLQTGRSASESISAQTSGALTRQASDGAVQDSVCIIDTKGRVLEPGDAVEVVCGVSNIRWGVYVGHQQAVLSDRKGKQVKEESLDLTRPFYKIRVSSGECRVFPPEERVKRAKSWTGAVFTEEDGACVGLDFAVWVYTGLVYIQAVMKGFAL